MNNKAVKPIWKLNPQKGQLTFLKSPDEVHLLRWKAHQLIALTASTRPAEIFKASNFGVKSLIRQNLSLSP
ncbi:hypothetical protein H5410_038003 [Solanum commersonii]|uniref:Uncharacterized protein n=1 Tax=Solanum commersonii TaxID=4109 RepID=A0A9J5Y7T6_SOLCO|nr:hypothetical protein H5410_038003 [Solanum commersonii]